MSISSASNGLASLAGRLTDPQDRESYARLIAYVQALPPSDEFRQQMEILGLLALLGQRVPDAVAELLIDLRAVDRRLAGLPGEISAGVDVAAIAKGMGEAFRQQLGATGLQETAVLLRGASKEINALANDISASLKPAALEYQTISSTISAELRHLVEASTDLEHYNVRLRERDRNRDWAWLATMALVLLLVGILGGILIEKRQTSDALLTILTQVERIEKPILSTVPAPRGIAKKR